MTEINQSARALEPVVELVTPLLDVAAEGMAAVIVWMPPAFPPDAVDRMERSAAAFISELSDIASEHQGRSAAWTSRS